MKLLLLIFFFVLTACNSSPNKVVGVKIGDEYYQTDQASSFKLTKTGDKHEVVCESHRKTGSHLKTKSCTTREEKRRERNQAEDMRRANSIHNSKVLTESFNGDG